MFSKATRRRSCAALMAAVGATAGLVATGAAANAGGKVTLVFTSHYSGNNDLDNWITAAARLREKPPERHCRHPEHRHQQRVHLLRQARPGRAQLVHHARYLLRGLVPGPVGHRRRVHPRLTAIDIRPRIENQYSVFHSITE